MARSSGQAVRNASAGAGPAYAASDVDDMERLALEKANKALSAIENALAVWESSPQKPEDMRVRVGRLKYFYDALTEWEKRMLRAMARKDDIDSRIARLREFSDICYAYA